MTTVTVDRAVLEQALEALEQCGLGDTHRSYEFEHAARAALRAALAQQERHVSYVCPQCYWSLEQPEPKQEPVAWQCQEHGDTEWFDCSKESYGINPRRYTYRALYTAPPSSTMVPLTDEEILAAVGWERAEMYMKLTPNFPADEAKKETLKNARAIEKASWEKNK